MWTVCQAGNGPYAREKKVAPAGNECYNVFFLMDFTFDLYVFHFSEWS